MVGDLQSTRLGQWPMGLDMRTVFSRNDFWLADYEFYTRQNGLRMEDGVAKRNESGFVDR